MIKYPCEDGKSLKKAISAFFVKIKRGAAFTDRPLFYRVFFVYFLEASSLAAFFMECIVASYITGVPMKMDA